VFRPDRFIARGECGSVSIKTCQVSRGTERLRFEFTVAGLLTAPPNLILNEPLGSPQCINQEFTDQRSNNKPQISCGDDIDSMFDNHLLFAETALKRGNWSAAEAHAQEALEQFRRHGISPHEGRCLRILGEAALAQERVDQAESYFHGALMIAELFCNEEEWSACQLRLNHLHLLHGRQEDYLTTLRKLWAIPEKQVEDR
jgi:tetratricopeptide (TPR) repeat protein